MTQLRILVNALLLLCVVVVVCVGRPQTAHRTASPLLRLMIQRQKRNRGHAPTTRRQTLLKRGDGMIVEQMQDGIQWDKRMNERKQVFKKLDSD
jgi:photosystem II stability/assembly factor-like uncharacterized protein